MKLFKRLIEAQPPAFVSNEGEGVGSFLRRVLGEYDSIVDPKTGIDYCQKRGTPTVYKLTGNPDGSNRSVLLKTNLHSLPKLNKKQQAKKQWDQYGRNTRV